MVATLVVYPAQAGFDGSQAIVNKRRGLLSLYQQEVRGVGLGFLQDLIKLSWVAAERRTVFYANIDIPLLARWALCLHIPPVPFMKFQLYTQAASS